MNPDQFNQIETWAEKRDTILNEIRILNSEKESLVNDTKKFGLALADLHNSINEANGRISELVELENRYRDSVSKEVSELVVQKSKLESDIAAQTIQLKMVLDKERGLVKLIDSFTSFYEEVSNKINDLNNTASNSVQNSQASVLYANSLIETLKKSVEDLIDVTQRNVNETNVVLNKLPAMLVELQKAKLIRHKI